MAVSQDAEGGFDMEAYKNNLDKGMTGVMPDYWLGHARVAIYEADLTLEERRFARRLAKKLLEEGDSTDSAKVAGKVAINKTKEHLRD